MNNNKVKTFGEVKKGDTVYKVVIYNYKTRIIKKTVKLVMTNVNSIVPNTVSLHLECKDSEYYSNIFNQINSNSCVYKDKYANNVYLCTDLEIAKNTCSRLTNEIISKAEKEFANTLEKLKRWNLHKTELNNKQYIIV